MSTAWSRAKSALKRVLGRYYFTSKLRHHYLLRRSYAIGAARQPVLVYQMGKVGSRTLASSLESAYPHLSVFHVHALTTEGLRRLERLNQRYWRPGRRALHVWTGQYLRRRIRRQPPGGRWKIITLVRDPVARNVSAFFQVLEIEMGYDILDRARRLSGEELVDELVEMYWTSFTHHDQPLIFFDNELKKTFGVDVLASDFPKSKGYGIYEGQNADILVLKLEVLDRCAAEALREFLGLQDFVLAKENLADQKHYAEAYKRFRSAMVFPDEYLDRMYSSRYARTFYTDSELEQFRKKWRTQRRSSETARAHRDSVAL